MILNRFLFFCQVDVLMAKQTRRPLSQAQPNKNLAGQPSLMPTLPVTWATLSSSGLADLLRGQDRGPLGVSRQDLKRRVLGHRYAPIRLLAVKETQLTVVAACRYTRSSIGAAVRQRGLVSSSVASMAAAAVLGASCRGGASGARLLRRVAGASALTTGGHSSRAAASAGLIPVAAFTTAARCVRLRRLVRPCSTELESPGGTRLKPLDRPIGPRLSPLPSPLVLCGPSSCLDAPIIVENLLNALHTTGNSLSLHRLRVCCNRMRRMAWRCCRWPAGPSLPG